MGPHNLWHRDIQRTEKKLKISETSTIDLPKGPSRAVFSTESDSVVFYYPVVNLLRIVIHYLREFQGGNTIRGNRTERF